MCLQFVYFVFVAVDHDDSPNSPPTVVSSQGSSVDMGVLEEVCLSVFTIDLCTNCLYICPGYDVKLHPVTKAQFSTIEVLIAIPMTRWEFRIVPCLAGGNASETCLKMLVMRFAYVQ